MKQLSVLILSLVMMMNTAFAEVVQWVQPEGDVKAVGYTAEEKLANNSSPKHVILLIGDGLGFSQRQITEYYNMEVNGSEDKLVMNQLPEGGINSTHSANTLIVDSAAAGTALASGVKTNNGVIGKDADLKDVKTLVELAEESGQATGLVTTTRLTHATPAAFASHNESRGNENEIAYDYLDSGVDFFAGGGLRHFIPQDFPSDTTDYAGNTIKSKRKDDMNLVSEFEKLGYTTFTGNAGVDAFKTAKLEKGDKVFAAFTYTHLPYEIDRTNNYTELPSLAEMTSKAIDLLSKDDDGFFLMVEGGRIDHAAHANDLPGVVHDTLAFDAAVKEAYDFYMANPNDTLVIVVGDHETGGLGLGMDKHGYFVDIASIKDVKASIADNLMYGNSRGYTGDKDDFLKKLADNYDLGDLNGAEAARLNTAMSADDKGQTAGYYDVSPVALTVSHIISERANVHWTTTIHTGAAIPFTAIGTGADEFNGYIDNTDISKTLADLMGVSFE